MLQGKNQRLKIEREKKSLSQQQVADALGITKQAYSKLESGRTRISKSHLSTLKQALKFDITFIAKGDEVIRELGPINRRLIELRENKSVEMRIVAEKTGIKQDTLYTYEYGANPNPSNLKRLADYYGVSVKYLLHGIDDNPEIPQWREMLDKFKAEMRAEFMGEVNEIKSILLKAIANGNFPEGNQRSDNGYFLHYDKVA